MDIFSYLIFGVSCFFGLLLVALVVSIIRFLWKFHDR